MFKGKVQGFGGIYQALDALPANVGEKKIQQALTETADETLTPAARLYAWKSRSKVSRRGYGHLDENIKTFPRPSEGSTVRVAVGFPRKFFWGMFLEFGTVKMPRSPFLRPAWDTWKKQLLDIYAAKLWKLVQPAVARAARGARK